MAYNYSNGDGVGALDETLPNGSTEKILILDDAIRQIKRYLKDPSDGPDGRIDSTLSQLASAESDISSNTTEINSLKTRVDTLENAPDNEWHAAFPVNSIFFTWDNNNPGAFLPGTWTQISQGRFIVGQGNNGSSNFAAQETGGQMQNSGGKQTPVSGTSGGHVLTSVQSGVKPHNHHESFYTGDATFNDNPSWSRYGLKSGLSEVLLSSPNRESQFSGTVANNVSDAEAASADSPHDHGPGTYQASVPSYQTLFVWRRTS